jgi:hypothetical protein
VNWGKHGLPLCLIPRQWQHGLAKCVSRQNQRQYFRGLGGDALEILRPIFVDSIRQSLSKWNWKGSVDLEFSNATDGSLAS